MLLFLFLNYWLLILVTAVIAQFLNLRAGLEISIGIQTKEAQAEIETYPVTTEAKKESV